MNSFSSVEYSRDFWILPSWDKFNFDLSLDNSRSFHWNLISIFDRISYFWSKTDQSCRKNHLPGTVKSNFVGFYILFFVKIGVFSFLTFSFNLERIQENLRRTKPTLYRSMTHFFCNKPGPLKIFSYPDEIGATKIQEKSISISTEILLYRFSNSLSSCNLQPFAHRFAGLVQWLYF